MCMVEGCDDYATILSASSPVARKAHRCDECFRRINPGEKYLKEATLFEGILEVYKTCQHCQVVRQWLINECGGFLYRGCKEDLSDHACGYGMKVARMYVAMKNKWTTRKGQLMPVERFLND